MQVSLNIRRPLFEILAAVLTGIGKLVLVDLLDQKLAFVMIAFLFWLGYVIYAWRVDRRRLQRWGFSMNGFREGFVYFLPLALLCVAGFVIYGLWQDTIIFTWRILPIMLLYPLWGVIQQFLVVGLVAGNLNNMAHLKWPKWAIVLLTATMFAVVHYPSILLIVATFVMGIVYTVTYLKQPNLWVLGLYHGWLGGLFYYFVLGRDPFLEVFGTLIQ